MEKAGSFEGRASPVHLRMRPLAAPASAKSQPYPPKINHLPPSTSTPSQLVPKIPPFRSRIHRQACRRGGAGAGHEGQTQTSCTGLAENGLPPATRGEARGFGPDPRLLKPERARRACLCGTQGGRRGWCRRTVCPPSRRAFGEGALSVGGNSVRPCFWQPDEHRLEDPCRGTEVAGNNRRTGC